MFGYIKVQIISLASLVDRAPDSQYDGLWLEKQEFSSTTLAKFGEVISPLAQFCICNQKTFFKF